MDLSARGNMLIDCDWKEGRQVVESVRKIVADLDCAAMLPNHSGEDGIVPWLEQMNFLIGQLQHFSTGGAYELLDLDPESDVFTLLISGSDLSFLMICPKWIEPLRAAGS